MQRNGVTDIHGRIVDGITGLVSNAGVVGKSLFLLGTENLITHSEDMTDGSWVAHNGVLVSNVGPAADGSGAQTADRWVPSAVASTHFITTAVPLVGIGTVSTYAKPDGYSSMSFSNDPNNWVHFSLVGSGSISTLGTGWSAATIQYDPSTGFYLCTATSTNVTWGAAYLFTNPVFVASGDSTPSAAVGDGVKGVQFWGSMLNTGSQRLGYKKTP